MRLKRKSARAEKPSEARPVTAGAPRHIWGLTLHARARTGVRMDFATLAFFAGILALAALSPGPAVVALVAPHPRARADRLRRLHRRSCLGDMIWLTAACLGLAALAAALGGLFFLVRLAGAAYLLYLAYRLWTAPPKLPGEADFGRERGPLACSAPASPCPWAIRRAWPSTSLCCPTLVDLQHLTLLGFMEMSLVIAVVLAGVFAVYVLAADRARTLIASTRVMRWLNRTCGVAMAEQR